MKGTVEVGVDGTTWVNERGFGRFTREIVKALARREGEFRYTLVVDHEPASDVPEAVRALRVRTRRTTTEAAAGSGSRSLRDSWALSRCVARERFDLFFFPAVYSYFPVLSRVPCLVAFHDTIAERHPELVFPSSHNRRLWRLKVELARRQARRILTVSRASKRDLESILGIAGDRIDLTTEAADGRFVPKTNAASAAVRARHRIPDDAPLLLAVGGLSPHKNLLGLLRSFDRVLDGHPDAHLAIVGDTSGRDFHDNVAELERFVAERPRLGKRVRFTAHVSDDDLVALYNGAVALVSPSLWEGFGLPAIEAMSCGIPVLASRRGSLPEVVGDAGLFFEPESTEEMAAAITRVLCDADLRRELRRLALERAASFTWDHGASLVEDSFRRCLAGS